MMRGGIKISNLCYVENGGCCGILVDCSWCDVVQSVWREEEVQGQSHRDLYPDNVTVQQPAPAASHSLTIDNKTNIQVHSA